MGGRHCAQTELIKERLAKCEWLRIQLRRRRPTDRFGFTIVGGQQDGVGLYVKCVEVDSPADLAGLKEGDEVVVAEARDARILTRDEFVRLSVRRCSLTMFVKRKIKVPPRTATIRAVRFTPEYIRHARRLGYQPQQLPDIPAQPDFPAPRRPATKAEASLNSNDREWRKKGCPEYSTPAKVVKRLLPSDELAFCLAMSRHTERYDELAVQIQPRPRSSPKTPAAVGGLVERLLRQRLNFDATEH